MTVRGSGFTLVELLVALVLGTLVLGVAWSLVGRQAAGAAAVRERADRLEVVRAVRTVLGEELRAGVGGRDWSPPAGDSVALRAYRGVALACGSAEEDLGEDEVLVRYLGLRNPDPEKDSLLLLGEEGDWRPAALEARAPVPDTAAACPGTGGGWRTERWRLRGAALPFRAARLFERGSYHLVDRALRYRVVAGRGGRQPLTPELLDDETSGLEAGRGGAPVRLGIGFTSAGPGPVEHGGSRSSWSVAIWPPRP